PELQALKTRGAKLFKVNYDDEESLKKALSGSEYGVTVTEGPNAGKKAIHDLLKEVDLPYTIFYTGIFAEFLHMCVWLRHSTHTTEPSTRLARCYIDAFAVLVCFVTPSFLGYNFDEGYMNVVGKGETAFSITSRVDVGRFVAHVLATTPKSALEGLKLPFESERLSPLQIAALVEKKSGKKMEIRYVDYEENKKNYNTDFTAFLTTLNEDGRGCPGTEQEMKETVAKFFPDWNPAPYESFLA
ncbi:hypothetical protein BBJ28_00027128, partial [Nothophytophthora sp. Chile5]